MEWPGVLLRTNGTGQRILTVIIWFMPNDKNHSKNKTHSYFKIPNFILVRAGFVECQAQIILYKFCLDVKVYFE